MDPRHISSSRAHCDKIPTATLYIFGVELSNSGTVDVIGRRCVLDIQDDSQKITGSTNNFAGFTDIHVVPKTIQGFMTMYETSKSPAIMADAASCRKSKMM